MVFNTIVSCCFPPTWKSNLRGVRGKKASRRWLGGYTVSQLLVSLGSDADLITDWIYYENVVAGGVVPGEIITALQVFLGIATLLWVLEVLEGRVGLEKCCGLRLNNTRILWLGVLLEDIPQIGLTFYIDTVYSETGFSIQGVMNIAASLHDSLVKIRALLDNDVVEDNYDPFTESLLQKSSPTASLDKKFVNSMAAEI